MFYSPPAYSPGAAEGLVLTGPGNAENTDVGKESPGSAQGSGGGPSGVVSAGPVLSLREQAFGGLSRLIKRCAGTCLFGTGDALTREPLAWPGSLTP